MTSRWTNWAREQFCAPTATVRPASEAELVEVVSTRPGYSESSTRTQRVVW